MIIFNPANDRKECASCGFFNINDACFCTSCGNELDCIVCKQCGANNTKNSIFCMECGEKIRKEMEYLNLNPAESLLLINPTIDGKELFKLTFIDLLARHVISMEAWEEEKGILMKKPSIFHMVGRGEKFDYSLKNYEELYKKPFYKIENLEIKEYLESIFKEQKFLNKDFYHSFKAMVIDSLIHSGYLDEEYNSKDIYSPLGKQISKKIKNIFDDADSLGEWVENVPERAKAFLSVLGTHIFVLNYDLDTLRYLREHTNVETTPSKYYSYNLYPYFITKESYEIINDYLELGVLDILYFFDSLDNFDDIFDS